LGEGIDVISRSFAIGAAELRVDGFAVVDGRDIFAFGFKLFDQFFEVEVRNF